MGYVVTKELADQIQTDIVKELHIIVPPDSKVLYLENQIGKKIKNAETLVEFVYGSDLDNYLDVNQLDQIGEEDSEFLNLYSQGQNSIKLLGVDGEIVNIKVYINNKNSVDKKVIGLYNDLVDSTKEVIGKLANAIPDESKKIHSVDNIDVGFFKTGGHKYKNVEFAGARIVFLVRQNKVLREGDKIANRYNTCR